MIQNWYKNGNVCRTITFDKLNWKNIFRITKTNSKKGVDSYFERNIWILGFKFNYVDINYDDIVCVHIGAESKYKRCKDAGLIAKIKTALTTWATEGTWRDQYPPFNWNFLKNKKGNYEFYITGPKEWFEKHGIKSLVSPFREICWKVDDYKNYPLYDPKKTNRVMEIKKEV